MKQILLSYPAVPSNFKNLIVVPDVGFVSTTTNPFQYEKGEKYLRQPSRRFDLNKPFIIGKHPFEKQKYYISDIDREVKVTAPILSVPTDFTLSNAFPQCTDLDEKRCEQIYSNYEKFVNTNRDELVASVTHSEVDYIFAFSRRYVRFKPMMELVVKDSELLSVSESFNKKSSKVIPLVKNEIQCKVEFSKENFKIKFSFPFPNILWRDDYYLKIYSSGLLEFIPVKYNFSLYMKGKYSVLKQQEEFKDDDEEFFAFNKLN